MSKLQRGPFTQWLLNQDSRSDLVGELSEEVQCFRDWPPNDTLLACRVYMAMERATPLALYALQIAHLEWTQSKHLPEINTLVPKLLKHNLN